MDFNEWLGVSGLILTVIGFLFTFEQLRRTKRVAKATQDTVYRATDRVRYNQLLVLLPQLQNLEPELDNAVTDDNGSMAARTLVRWNQLGSQVEGILSTMPGYEDLASNLKIACDAAATAKGQLVDEVGLVKDVTREVRTSISNQLVALGGVLGSIATQASAPVETDSGSSKTKKSEDKG